MRQTLPWSRFGPVRGPAGSRPGEGEVVAWGAAGEPIDQFVLLLQEVTRRDRAVPRRDLEQLEHVPAGHEGRDVEQHRYRAAGAIEIDRRRAAE